jgi:CheY-like chemotaxis protein
MMPDVDGWAVLAALKADPELARIPVIVVTILDEARTGFALGAADYLTKPVDRDRLRGLVQGYAGTTAGPVLVVDDDPAVRDLVRRGLEREGLAVAEAADGRAALDEVARRRPALILLDLMMPVMDGFEFLDALGRQPEGGAIPVVVLTGRNLTPEDRGRLDSQVTRIIQKGVAGRDAVLAEIRERLAISR